MQSHDLNDIQVLCILRPQTDYGARTDKLLHPAVLAMAEISTATGTTSGQLPAVLRLTHVLKPFEVCRNLLRLVLYITSLLCVSGRAPSDAPETVVLANFVNKIAASPQKLKLYIDYHSYSQLFMTREPGPPLTLLLYPANLCSLWLLLYCRDLKQRRISISCTRGCSCDQERIRYCFRSRPHLSHYLPSVWRQCRLFD